MKIEKFAQRELSFKDIIALEAYQGYLITGKREKAPRCLWINKKNIEGLAEIAKIVAIESTFQGILSLIPGGSFAYKLIKDQIGYPPRYNVMFEPDFYDITYSVIMLDEEGRQKGMVDSLIQSVDSIAKTAFKTGTKIQDIITDFIIRRDKGQTKQERKEKKTESQIIGFTCLRFDDKTSIVRNRIVNERLIKTKSSSKKLIKRTVSEISPPAIINFKTTANEKAIIFLKHLHNLGFKVKFSESVIDGLI